MDDAPKPPPTAAQTSPPARWPEVLLVFLRLGLTSFGGPVAHLGYFREEFVARRRWLDDRAYADLVALCQFLPGPASSQVGIAIGLSRAGYAGGAGGLDRLHAAVGRALVLFAYGVSALGDVTGAGWLHGLKVAAVAVVAQAVLGHGALAGARPRACDAWRSVAAVIVLAVPSALGQVGAIVARRHCRRSLLPRAAVADRACRAAAAREPARRRSLLAIFFVLLIGLPLAGRDDVPRRRCSCSTPSTGRARWCSAAATWCCHCCRPRSCRRAG